VNVDITDNQAMFASAPAPLYYPLLLIWSLVYGAVAGAFFKAVAVYESWQYYNRYHIHLWKKYPRRSYQKYISTIWANEIRGKPVELAEYTRHQIERTHPTEPFPALRLVVNTLFMISILPFMLCSGLFFGPVYVYKRALRERNSKLNTKSHPQ
jgi:hypothetical protein